MQSPSIKIFYLNYRYIEFNWDSCLHFPNVYKAPTCGITREQVDKSKISLIFLSSKFDSPA